MFSAMHSPSREVEDLRERSMKKTKYGHHDIDMNDVDLVPETLETDGSGNCAWSRDC